MSPSTPQPDGRGGAGLRARPANRLIDERSPYLRQHAHNPVDWFPWGPEALEKARREQKPILLSIGYSTCHWCHVMERESFECEETARLLNRSFIAIKVDREERPDLDHLYMSALQALTGQGGWPMTVFLTPGLEPFFGGTYFPPEDRWGRPGFRTVLEDVAAVWNDRRTNVAGAAARVTEFLRREAHPAGGDERAVDDRVVDERAAVDGSLQRQDVSPSALQSSLTAGVEALASRYDAHRGGFGGEPKFPTPHAIGFLLRHAQRHDDRDALDMATHTLEAMAAGGIHDHLGGGFHRYATDAGWLVPHFEKMLYDQAGLALAYTEAWLVTRDARYAEVIRGILDYVLRDLTHPEGGFYSAEDADSEGEEGRFFVWTHAEILAVLGPEAGGRFCHEYGVAPGGNWEGRSILHRPAWDPRSNTGANAPPGTEAARPDHDLTRVRAILLARRNQRTRPHRDEKIIAAWNGYMIAALARAGRALGEPRYIAAAVRADAFLAKNLWRNGRLLRHFCNGQADALGCLDDHAYVGLGRIALHQATHRREHLDAADALAEDLLRLFRREDGALGYTGSDAEALLAPVNDVHDGAMPSSVAAATMFLLQLGHLSRRVDPRAVALDQFRALQVSLQRAPGAHLALLSAADFALGPVVEIGLSGEESDPGFAALRRVIDGAYWPNAIVTRIEEAVAEGTARAAAARGARGGTGIAGATAGSAFAQVCAAGTCRPPVRSPEDLAALLHESIE